MNNLFMFMDFHAHASKKGVFVFGNSLENHEKQVEAVLLAKLISMNSLNFDFSECNFSDKIMNKVDKNGESREGTGRVAIYQATGIAHCYTIECNYHNGKKINHIPQKMNLVSKQTEPEVPVTDIGSKLYSSGTSPPFTSEILEDAGRATGVAFLDIIGDNPVSRIATSNFKNVGNVREEINNMLSNKILVRKGKGSTAM